MAITSKEKLFSRDSKNSSGTFTYRQLWVVSGTSDPSAAVTHLEANAAPAVGKTLYQQSVTARLLSLQNEKCEGEIIWSTDNELVVVEYDNTIDTEFVTLEMAGETTHISFVDSAADQDHYYDNLGEGIGVNSDDTIDGVDVLEPTESLEIKIYKDPADIDAAFRSALRNIYMNVNDATWKGYGAGNLLFTGVTYGNSRDELMSVSFRFLARPQVTLQPTIIGKVTGANPPTIVKKGWEYYWVRRGPNFDFSIGVGAGDLKAGVKSAHVARVYAAADFSSAFPLDATKLFPTD